jgi:hypothetical protein
MLTCRPNMRRNWARGAAIGAALFGVPVAAGAGAKTSDKQDCIAAAEQGQSQRDDGQYRAARDSFVKCTEDVCPRVIVQSCTKWLRELDESAPTIVLGAKDEQGNDLTDATVRFDGVPFSTTLTGKPVEVDAGEHVVRFEREGRIAVEQRLLLRAGEKARVVSVTLLPVAGSGIDAASADASAVQGIQGVALTAPAERTLSAHHVATAAIGLGAVAAAVVGVVFVLKSNAKQDDAAGLRGTLPSDGCTGVSSPTCASLTDAVHAQHDDMNVAGGLFAVAGALAAGAVAAWVFWPRAATASPATTGWIGPIRGGVAVQVTGIFR